MRYYGKIGYFDTVETKPGFFENQMIYKTYKGDIIRNTKRNNRFGYICNPLLYNYFSTYLKEVIILNLQKHIDLVLK